MSIYSGAFNGYDMGETYCYDCADDCKYYRDEYCKKLSNTIFIDEYGRRDICPYFTKNKKVTNARTEDGKLEYQGKMHTIKQIAELEGINASTLTCDLCAGMELSAAIEKGINYREMQKAIKKKNYCYNGQLLSVQEIAKMAGCSASDAMFLLKKGLNVSQIIQRFATKKNTGKTVRVFYKGNRITISEIARKTGVPTSRIRKLITLGYSPEDILDGNHK